MTTASYCEAKDGNIVMLVHETDGAPALVRCAVDAPGLKEPVEFYLPVERARTFATLLVNVISRVTGAARG